MAIRTRLYFACALALLLAPMPAAAQLNVLCPMAAEWCSLAATEFEKATGIKPSMTLKGSGESFAQVAAEKANPKLDIWFGGTGDPHLQAAELDLTMPYKSPLLDQLQPWAKKQAEQSGYKAVGLYLGVLGIGYNTELVAKKKLPPPACWKDLAKPIYAGDVQMANPNASGTAYTAIATLVQLFGEEDAFKLLKDMHKNISSYSRQGVGPIKATARGENMVAVAFIHDVVTEAQGGFPVKSVAPCEGTGYEIISSAIIKGGPNPEGARKWMDFVLSPAGQNVAVTVNKFQVPSNRNAQVHPMAPKASEVKLIKLDLDKYGSKQGRDHLLSRWENEVFKAPK